LAQASIRWNTSEALVPPNPKLFDMDRLERRIVDALPHDRCIGKLGIDLFDIRRFPR